MTEESVGVSQLTAAIADQMMCPVCEHTGFVCKAVMLDDERMIEIRCRRCGAGEAIAMGSIISQTVPPTFCTTKGCPGDPRYAAPGRGHIEGCSYPW